MSKQRLDLLVVKRGLAATVYEASRLILAAQVLVDGHAATKVGSTIRDDSRIELKDKSPFVSRGGQKLQKAFEHFPINVDGMICLDIGASTGGFTDCLLQNGAAKVMAIDVGKGLLNWSLRNDPRVTVIEETNARYLKPDDLPLTPAFICIDVSFISLTKILPAAIDVLQNGGHIVTLIKPQFEAARAQVKKGGVIRDPLIREEIVAKIRHFGETELQLRWLDCCESPLRGPAGNVEFLAYWRSNKGEHKNKQGSAP